MPVQYGVAEAKNNLPRLIKAVLQGERVVITNRGADAVELVPVASSAGSGFGSMPGLTASLPAGWDSIEEKNKLASLFEDLD